MGKVKSVWAIVRPIVKATRICQLLHRENSLISLINGQAYIFVSQNSTMKQINQAQNLRRRFGEDISFYFW